MNDLIASSTLEQARVAARQLGGGMAKTVAPVKAGLVGMIAEMEAGIDFAEDDVAVMSAERIAGKIAEVRAPLTALDRGFAYGRIVHEGLRLAIVGRPNAASRASSTGWWSASGPSSPPLRAPPATGDGAVSLDGIPIGLIDTGGLGSRGLDEVERLGIARSREAMAEADVVLLVVDATLASLQGISPEDRRVLEQVDLWQLRCWWRGTRAIW